MLALADISRISRDNSGKLIGYQRPEVKRHVQDIINYLNGDKDKTNPYACPAEASSLRGLPPALVVTAGFDPLRDEGETYAARLQEAGVKAECIRYEGVTHGFVLMAAVLDEARKSIADMGAALKAGLKK